VSKEGDIKLVDKGLLYYNRQPQFQSVHAYFPFIEQLTTDEMICFYSRGSAMASADKVVGKSRSTDGGRTWKEEGTVWDPARDDKKYCYYHGAPAMLRDGRLTAVMTRFDRSDPDELMWDPVTSGYPYPDIVTCRSEDKGLTWSRPQVVPLPQGLIGNHSGTILELDNGELLLTLETWKHSSDTRPPVQRSLGLFSKDGGKSWGDLVSVADGSSEGIYYFDQRLALMGKGSIMALLWTFRPADNKTLPVHITVSHDSGKTWSDPVPTNIDDGFISYPVYLGGSKFMAAYTSRYGKVPGIYAVISHDGGFSWDIQDRLLLYDATGKTSTGIREGESELQSMMGYAFGMPQALLLQDGDIMVSYWCTEGCITHIQWCRVAL